MSVMNKIFGSGAKLARQATLRFADGFSPMGVHIKAPDTRTTEQLLENIDYFADRLPEVARFRNELKSMNPKHLGLVSDICELGTRIEMLNTGINIRIPAENGKSLLEFLMEKLPKASKENPQMIEFAQEVINNTDSIASKYFLGSFAQVFEHPEAARHLEATRPLIKDIAEATLNGGYTMDFSKQQRFVNGLSKFINSSADPEKIKFIQRIIEATKKIPEHLNLSCYINGPTIAYAEKSVPQMQENLDTFMQIAEGLSKKTSTVDLSEFLTRNVNLT